MTDSELHMRTLCRGRECGEGILYTLWHFEEVSVWITVERPMAATFVYTIPVWNSLFVKLFGIICVWRIPYKTSVYSFLCYAFGAWHAAFRKVSTQLLLTPLGTALLAVYLGAVERYASKWKQREDKTQVLFSCWKFYGQPEYKQCELFYWEFVEEMEL